MASKIKYEVNKGLAELKGKAQEAETMSVWHEKQLKIKENLLKEFDYNLKKLMEEVEVSSEKEKKLIFERDEYKYLLTNVRESMIEVKKEHEEKIARVIK